MVLEHQGEHASQWVAICSIAAKIGCSGETLLNWVPERERKAGCCLYFRYFWFSTAGSSPALWRLPTA
jgi:hypothetical protein